MEALDPATQLFLQYDYAEFRDLLRSLLTLAASILAFSVAFSDRIVRTQEASLAVRRIMFAGWLGIFASIVTIGTALVLLTTLVSCALYQSMPIVGTCSGKALIWVPWALMVLSGMLFAAGLCALMVAAARGLRLGKDEGS